MTRQPSFVVRRAALIATLVLMPVAAAAQAGNPGSLPNMPAWDGNFSLGLLSGEIEGPNDRSDRLEARFDIGRYWTSHVKTELGLSLPNRWSSYDYTSFPVPGLQGGGFSSSQQSQQLVIVAPTLTYQFLENAFAHPYLSTGLRLMWLRTHATRAAQTYTQNRI